LSYDSFHQHASSIYRTTTASYRNGEFRGAFPLSGYAQGPALLQELPEVKTFVRTHPTYGSIVITNKNGSGQPVSFREEGLQFVDSTFFRIFTYTPLLGQLKSALDRPGTIVLTRSMADKYFGKDSDPIGEVLSINGGWSFEAEVTAVIGDVPGNTHFPFDFAMNIHDLLQTPQYKEDDGWGWSNFVTYVQLHPNVDLTSIPPKLEALVEKYQGENLASSNTKEIITLQPVTNVHLEPGLSEEQSPTVSRSSIYFFVIISLFILAIAWVNYINLSTARAMERSREVGIKKAVGAFKTQLMFQFLFESVIVNLLGVVLAVGLAAALMPVLAGIVDKNIAIDFSDPRLWMVMVGLLLAGSFVSGAYPALVLSSFKVSAVIKGESVSQGGFSLRKALVVFQFVASLVLIAGTFAVYRQLNFMRDEDKGLAIDQMLVIKGPNIMEGERAERRERFTTLKNEYAKIPGVMSVSTSATIPGGGFNWGTGMRRSGTQPEENRGGNVTWVDPDFISTYGIELLSGRTWNPEIESDFEAALINEATATIFGLGDAENALQEKMIVGGDTVNILGVLKNYHWTSLKNEHGPILLFPTKITSSCYSLHLSKGADYQSIIGSAEEVYKNSFPGNPFDYYFLDDFFDLQYKSDQQFGKIFTVFSLLAISIACLGLFGLASFTTTQKLREISIRKVMGASVSSIVVLLSRQFIALVLIASVIAVPLIWYGLDTWLDTFAFRIGLGWDLFVIPMTLLTVIALLTVGMQIVKGANTNPAQILRTE
jgi:putative ABC transport system permease protein